MLFFPNKSTSIIPNATSKNMIHVDLKFIAFVFMFI